MGPAHRARPAEFGGRLSARVQAIQAGGDFAKLSAEEHAELLNTLLAQPDVRQRPRKLE